MNKPVDTVHMIEYTVHMTIPMSHLIVRNRVREIRRKRGLTQIELAEMAGISPTTIGFIETRENWVARRAIRERLAQALGLGEDDLFYAEAIA